MGKVCCEDVLKEILEVISLEEEKGYFSAEFGEETVGVLILVEQGYLGCLFVPVFVLAHFHFMLKIEFGSQNEQATKPRSLGTLQALRVFNAIEYFKRLWKRVNLPSFVPI